MKKSVSGFTVVELLIVIVVIAILAVISIVAYNGIQDRARESEVKMTLSNAAKWLKAQYAIDGEYPSTLDDALESGTVTLSLANTDGEFCINGSSKAKPSIMWHYGSSSNLMEGVSEGSAAGNLITDTMFTGSGPGNGTWQVSRSVGAIPATTRAGQSGDPFPTRPVLRYTNTTSSTVAWGVIHGRIDATQIEQGKTYTQTMYVRLVSGNFPGNISHYSVRDTNHNNGSIPNASTGSPLTSQWQKFTRTVTANANGISSNVYYLPLQSSQSQNAAWVIELQGLELREQ